MSSALIELFRHKTWATVRLIEHCSRLDDRLLDSTTPGTFGAISATLRHLVATEERFLGVIVSDSLADLPATDTLGMDELARRIEHLGEMWDAIAEDLEIQTREFVSRTGWRMPGAIPMAEAIHHAEHHRTHVLSTLGANGLDVPDLDVWEYGRTAGLMHR